MLDKGDEFPPRGRVRAEEINHVTQVRLDPLLLSPAMNGRRWSRKTRSDPVPKSPHPIPFPGELEKMTKETSSLTPGYLCRLTLENEINPVTMCRKRDWTNIYVCKYLSYSFVKIQFKYQIFFFLLVCESKSLNS